MQSSNTTRTKSVAFHTGYKAHADGRMRTPALDAQVMELIKVQRGQPTRVILKILEDWLSGWDKRNAEN